VDPKDVRAAQDGFFLLDVREPSEWRFGHIDGAKHIPMQQLGARRAELPSDVTIVCVCRSGHRSQAVTDALIGAGYTAVNLDGGMYAWKAAGLPIVTDEGDPGGVL
jgi:rhodanese-related sulfurtransferase